MNLRDRLLPLLLAAASAHCATTSAPSRSMQPIASARPVVAVSAPAPPPPVQPPAPPPPTEREITLQAEQSATTGGRRVLATMRTMIDDSVAIRGTCYTWLSAVYRNATGPRVTVFSGDRRGRYANVDQLQPGDWIHFINHSYNNVTHSAVFIAWVDRAASVALTASHPGQQRNEPGRYRTYDLTSVYRIDRMRE